LQEFEHAYATLRGIGLELAVKFGGNLEIKGRQRRIPAANG
jgi:hypothetical protein